MPFKRLLGTFGRAIVWAYGIEVWGRYGREAAPALALADHVWTISAFTDGQVKEGWPEARTEVVHLGVEETAPAGRRDRSAFGIITVARLDASEGYKGHDLTLHAMAALAADGIRFRYDVVGDGSDLSRLKALAESLGLREWVCFHGFLPSEAVSRLLDEASLFVMPSRVVRSADGRWGGEGFGLVYVEAAMHGLASVACDEGGQVDFVIDGETGFLVAPAADAVAAAIRRAFMDRDLLEKLGSNGRELARRSFSATAFRSRILGALEKQAT